MMRKHINLFLAGISLVCFTIFSQDGFASVEAEGTFIAEKTCQAYVSMRKRTNPDDAVIVTGESYKILELNVPDGTTWYRVEVPGASPTQRWVYFECGKANVTSSGTGPGHGSTGKKPCNTAGLADGYKFAVSWQPAFCEMHRDKPECGVTDPDSYQAGNFTLHGLWPNKSSCGTHYGSCGKYRKPLRPFCKYPPVPITKPLLNKLGTYMPSVAHGSCLQRHEWYKHGTCQTTWGAEGYFETAIRLVQEFNNSGISAFMKANVGKQVEMDVFFKKIDQSLGEGAHSRMKVMCKNKNGDLVDIYINLPAAIPADASLSDLIQQAPKDFSNNCGNSFTIDDIRD